MAGRKRAGSKRGSSVELDQPSAVPAAVAAKLPDMPSAPKARISEAMRFPLLVGLSMATSSILYAASSSFTSGDLSTVSAHRDQWWEVAGLLGWRATELAVGWYGGYDSRLYPCHHIHQLLTIPAVIDQLALTYLTHLPYLFFLTSFYKIRPTTALACLIIDMIATSIPFRLLRTNLASHGFKTPKGAIANRSVINDYGVQAGASLFASGIYSVIVVSSFGTWMPKYLVTHFDGIKDISLLYNSTFIWLAAALIPTGIAAKIFLFTPAVAAKPDSGKKNVTSFDAETATMRDTIAYNLWGHSKRIRILMQRTGTLASMVGLHTWLHTYVAVDGAEGFGAAGWSAVWALAATCTGVAFIWISDVDGMSN